MSPSASSAVMWSDIHSSTKANARSLIPAPLVFCACITAARCEGRVTARNPPPRGGSLFLLQQFVALLGEPVQLVLLGGDAVGVAAFVAGAGIRRSLLDQLADIVAHDGDAPLDLRKRKRTAVAHQVSPRTREPLAYPGPTGSEIRIFTSSLPDLIRKYMRR